MSLGEYKPYGTTAVTLFTRPLGARVPVGPGTRETKMANRFRGNRLSSIDILFTRHEVDRIARAYLYELKRGDRGQPVELRIVERAGRVRRVVALDPVDDALRVRGPVRCGERESVVAARVHRIGLKNRPRPVKRRRVLSKKKKKTANRMDRSVSDGFRVTTNRKIRTPAIHDVRRT